VLTPCRVDSLATGALVSILIVDAKGLIAWTKRLRLLALGSATGLLILIAHYGRFNRDDLFTTVFGYSLLAIFSAWCVLACAQLRSGSVSTRIVANPVLSSLGKYSYGIYVTHMFFAPAYTKLFGWNTLIGLTGSYNAAIVIHIVLATACSWAIAAGSYHMVEKHFLKLKAFFDYRRATAPEAVPAPEPIATRPVAIAIAPSQAMRQAA
jgi:peptidoglycan/LPS O-acetylase OafA/YrhL